MSAPLPSPSDRLAAIPRPPPRPERPRSTPWIFLAFLCGIGVAVAINAKGSRPEAPPDAAPAALPLDLPVSPEPAAAIDPARRTPVVEAVRKVAPAVVSITTQSPISNPFEVMRTRSQVSSQEGSGVVIDASGVVLTNAHVVENAAQISVSFADGTNLRAQVVGLTPDLDLAVLKVDSPTPFTPAPIGTSADLLLGEPVIAIGNPFGLGHTVTTGVVSALSRPLQTDARVYQDFIQTDASINPGNSGGPLLNAKGELIGINTAIRADAQGIGFAIPVDRAMKVARDLIQFRAVQIPWLGVSLEDVRKPQGHSYATFARVKAVFDGSGGALAGLQPGDLILSAGDKTIQGRGDLNAWLAARDLADPVPLSVLRGESTLKLSVTPSKVPADAADHILTEAFGVKVVERDQQVLIERVLPNSPLGASLNLRPGDRIASINGVTVHSVTELRDRLTAARSAHKPDITVQFARGEHTLAISLLI